MRNDRNFIMVDGSELDDFRKICQKHRIKPDAFDLNEHDVIYPLPNIVGPTIGKITITSKAGLSRTYRTGYLSTWLKDFENDLNKGVFSK